jgi:hypothetical protein
MDGICSMSGDRKNRNIILVIRFKVKRLPVELGLVRVIILK